jgi:hypothetical protein
VVAVSLDSAVKNSIAAGVFYAVAAGNDNASACNYSPARVGAALTVGATESDDDRSSFSNYGPCVNIFAPGTDILSAYNASDSATTTMNGTSMASPHAAGVAARILEELPSASPVRVFNIIISGATTGRLSNIGSGSPNRLLYSSKYATFVDQNVPLEMVAGMPAQVSITMKNTGVTTWRWSQGYKLGSQPGGDMTWGLKRVLLVQGESIAPRKTKTFTFNVTAPTEPGIYDFQWRMVHEGVSWFGELTPKLSITVRAPRNDAEFVAQSVPTTMEAGETYPVWIKMKNTGETTWTRAGRYKLGSQNPQDNQTWGRSRAWLPGDDYSVEPGETHKFAFDVTAPAVPGIYNFRWRMVQELEEWFGQYTPNVAVQVTPLQSCPGTDHKWQSDYYGQVPHESPDQPDPPVCLQDDRCLYSSGSAADHGDVSGAWICSWDNIDSRPQGAWYLCESTRANANKVIEDHLCQQVGSGYEWVEIPPPCPGTEHKWQSDFYGQTPYQSPVQPDPPVCLQDDRCLYSDGSAVAHGTLSGSTWICSWDYLDGHTQGVWYQCEATRANANKVIEGYECEPVGGGYEWLPEGPYSR